MGWADEAASGGWEVGCRWDERLKDTGKRIREKMREAK